MNTLCQYDIDYVRNDSYIIDRIYQIILSIIIEFKFNNLSFRQLKNN